MDSAVLVVSLLYRVIGLCSLLLLGHLAHCFCTNRSHDDGHCVCACERCITRQVHCVFFFFRCNLFGTIMMVGSG